MDAFEAGTLLTRLARGGDVDLGEGEQSTLAALVRDGLVAQAPDVSSEQAELEATRRELATLAAPTTARTPQVIERERALRTRALELVEITSKAQGAAVVRGAGMGPYRAGGGAQAYVVTYAARALLSDLAPRLGRAGRMSLADFRTHMTLLRDVFAHRAKRAQALAGLMRLSTSSGAAAVSDGAVRAAAIGLAARNEPERELAATWGVLVQSLTQADALDASGKDEWTPDQESAAAEGMMLATRNLSALTPAAAQEAHRQRLDLYRRYTQGFAEDALDATMILAGNFDAIAHAAELAAAASAYGTPLPLSAALVLCASPATDRAGLVAQIRARFANLQEGVDERERTYAAVLLCLAGQDPAPLVDRARDLRAYLARFAPDGMLVPAALLALLPIDVAETLDLLRMVSAELQKHRFGGTGAESLSLSIKLLLATALLARGEEGDPEERAGFLRFDALAAAQLGLAGVVSQVPLSFTALTAFHRPALDSTAVYERIQQPTHSPYVFGRSNRSSGSSRSYGWG